MPRTRDLVAALWVTLIPALAAAQATSPTPPQSGGEPQNPAQKRPAKPGAQAGRTPGDMAASAAAPTASTASAAQAEKKPAKTGAQGGRAPSGASAP